MIFNIFYRRRFFCAVRTFWGRTEIAEDEIPFDIPESWCWVRLNSVISLLSGSDLTPDKYNDSVKGIPYITGASNIEGNQLVINRWTEHPNNIAHRGDLLLTCKGTVGKTTILNEEQVHIARQLMAITPLVIDTEFLKAFIESQIEGLKSKAKSMIPGIERDDVLKLLLPLPPLAEQKRIVAKIEELLPLIDRYEQAWSKLEDFNKRFPVDMQKSILQMAIQGKLVEQRPEEGTGEELYQQIQAEKQAMIKAGKIKKEKPLPEIAEDEIPFEIPESWKWVRLIDLCKSISDGDHQPPPQVSYGVPFLVISNVSAGSIDFSNTRYVPQNYFDALSGDRVAEKGDILFTVTGSYGIPIKVDCEQKFCFQRHIALLKLLIDWNYLFFALTSPVIKSQCDIAATGTAQKTVGLKSLRSMLIPLPPLAEQKRIVAKLEEILPLCERLK